MRPIHAALRQSPGALYVRAHSGRVDLAPIGDLLGLENTRGRVRVDVDALLRSNGAQGRVQVDLHEASFEALSGVEAHLAATLDGRHVSGSLSAEVADIGKLDVHTSSLEIGGSDAPSWSYWKRAWGSADAEGSTSTWRSSRSHLPKGSMPFGADTGIIDVAASLRSRLDGRRHARCRPLGAHRGAWCSVMTDRSCSPGESRGSMPRAA